MNSLENSDLTLIRTVISHHFKDHNFLGLLMSDEVNEALTTSIILCHQCYLTMLEEIHLKYVFYNKIL